jgi:hypothetical protein
MMERVPSSRLAHHRVPKLRWCCQRSFFERPIVGRAPDRHLTRHRLPSKKTPHRLRGSDDACHSVPLAVFFVACCLQMNPMRVLNSVLSRKTEKLSARYGATGARSAVANSISDQEAKVGVLRAAATYEKVADALEWPDFCRQARKDPSSDR